MTRWIENGVVTELVEFGAPGRSRSLVTSPAQLARLEARGVQPPRPLQDLQARARANELMLRGLELEQAAVAQRFEDDRNGTAARRTLERYAELAQVRDPSMSAAEAMELAAKESPDLYAEYTRKITATHGGPQRQATSNAAAEEVLRLAKAEQARDTTLSLAAATVRVFQQQPALYARYTAETAVKV